MPAQLHQEIWSHVCSFLYQDPPTHDGAPGRTWREMHQHDLTAMMRVNTMMHDAAAPHLYARAAVANIPSFFHSFDAPQAPNRIGKRGQLAMVKSLTLFNPKTYVRSSRREPSPNVFMIDPVYPYPDRRTLRVVDEALAGLADTAFRVEAYAGGTLLPQVEHFTLTTLNTDRWDVITNHILAGDKEVPRFAHFHTACTLFPLLVRHAADADRKLTRNWRLWPIHGPHAKAGEAIFEQAPANTTLTQHVDQFSIVLPDVQLNRLVLLKPLILEHTIPRFLNWPELSGRLRVALANAQKNDMKVEIECRLVPTAKEAKTHGLLQSERDWEMDKLDEMNEALEDGVSEDWRGRVKLIWAGDKVAPAPVERRRGR